MQLEEFFDFVSPERIRLRGRRLGVETILDDYLHGASPEEIRWRYRTLSLEQVYATIAYYLAHRGEMDAYLRACQARDERAIRDYEEGHP